MHIDTTRCEFTSTQPIVCYILADKGTSTPETGFRDRQAGQSTRRQTVNMDYSVETEPRTELLL